MEIFHVISGLRIKGTSIISTTTKEEIIERQGSADGACGPYSIFMILKILGLLKKENLPPNNKVDKRTRISIFLNGINNLHGLIKDGTYLRELEDLIDKSLGSKVHYEPCELENKELIDFVLEKLNAEIPLMVGVTFPTGGHWMVAVGYVKNDNGKVSKLLFLDPSGEIPHVSPWNSIIDVSQTKKGDYPYLWQSFGQKVGFQEALAIWEK